MNMSYRRAWLLVDEIYRICGHAVVETHEGGKGGGATLTPFGLTLVAHYQKIQRAMERAVRKDLRALCADFGK
jgi:molybdate transport system regulatory protein